jgi:hypothetical protein
MIHGQPGGYEFNAFYYFERGDGGRQVVEFVQVVGQGGSLGDWLGT